MSWSRASSTPASGRSLGHRLAALLVVCGLLVVGYAPFLHAYNAVYYSAILPCRSIGTAWLSLPFTLAVPLLGFALVALGASFVTASRSACRTAWQIEPAILADRLELPLRLLTAVALVSGLGYVMSSEVYDRAPLEGVRFARPRLDEWVTVALPAVTALLLGRLVARLLPVPGAGGARMRATPGRARWLGLAARAGWVLPAVAIARGGWDIHFDVPPGFVLVLEWALALALGLSWASGASRSVLARLALTFVVAELVRVCFADSATSLIHSRARDFTFYERHLFTVGRFVNGTVAMVWIAVFAGCCVVLPWNDRRERGVAATPPDGQGMPRSVLARLAAQGTHWFLVLSVVWFVASMTGLELFRIHDRIAGECAPADPIATRSIIDVTVSGAQILAGWVLAMGAAHLMTSAAVELRTALLGLASNRHRSDARAWQAMLGAALVLCVISWAHLAWLAATPR